MTRLVEDPVRVARIAHARGERAMVLPLAAPRWVGGSGARAQGPFAPGGQWITLPVIRVEAAQHHHWCYREWDPGEQPPGGSPCSRRRTKSTPLAPRAPACIAGQARNDRRTSVVEDPVRVARIAH